MLFPFEKNECKSNAFQFNVFNFENERRTGFDADIA